MMHHIILRLTLVYVLLVIKTAWPCCLLFFPKGIYPSCWQDCQRNKRQRTRSAYLTTGRTGLPSLSETSQGKLLSHLGFFFTVHPVFKGKTCWFGSFFQRWVSFCFIPKEAESSSKANNFNGTAEFLGCSPYGLVLWLFN